MIGGGGRADKARENAAALEVLPDLLRELDRLPPRERLTAIIQAPLAHFCDLRFSIILFGPPAPPQPPLASGVAGKARWLGRAINKLIKVIKFFSAPRLSC